MRAFSTILILTALVPAAAGAQASSSGQTDPDAAYYFLLGRRFENERKIDEAIAAHKKAVELAPTSAEVQAELAGLYARQDRAREALDTAEAALKIDPSNREANRILGTVLAALSLLSIFPLSLGTLAVLLGIAGIVMLYLPATSPYFAKRQPFANPYGQPGGPY